MTGIFQGDAFSLPDVMLHDSHAGDATPENPRTDGIHDNDIVALFKQTRHQHRAFVSITASYKYFHAINSLE